MSEIFKGLKDVDSCDDGIWLGKALGHVVGVLVGVQDSVLDREELGCRDGSFII